VIDEMELAQQSGGLFQLTAFGVGARYLKPHLHILTTSLTGQTQRKAWLSQLREAKDAVKDLETKVMDRLEGLEQVGSTVLCFAYFGHESDGTTIKCEFFIQFG
jgi:hypothetical protein